MTARACPLLVPLIEKDGSSAPSRTRSHAYLGPLVEEGIDTLGWVARIIRSYACIARLLGEGSRWSIRRDCASAVSELLIRENLRAPENSAETESRSDRPPDNFLRVAREALQLEVGEVQLRDVTVHAL